MLRGLANLTSQAYNSSMPSPLFNTPAHWQHLLPQPDARSHKYNRGYVLIQGGYPVTGAARLAALAAARTGAGMTSIAVPDIALPIYASQCLSIMVKPYTQPDALYALIADQRVSACLIGPGAGVSEQTLATTLNMLASGKPVVIDADAVSSLNGQVDLLKNNIQSSCVLTPHDGEFARLFGHRPDESLPTRLKQAQEAARLSQAIVLLKGTLTIIATPDGRLIVNDNAPATLATAGAGDVLAGMITSLLAQSMPAFEACAAATWLHGAAASLFGVGLIADDLPGLIPAALRSAMAAPAAS